MWQKICSCCSLFSNALTFCILYSFIGRDNVAFTVTIYYITSQHYCNNKICLISLQNQKKNHHMDVCQGDLLTGNDLQCISTEITWSFDAFSLTLPLSFQIILLVYFEKVPKDGKSDYTTIRSFSKK